MRVRRVCKLCSKVVGDVGFIVSLDRGLSFRFFVYCLGDRGRLYFFFEF